jgi:transposase
MDLTEIQKQTIAQRDGISIRTIAAEVGVHKRTVFFWPAIVLFRIRNLGHN